MSQKNWGGGGQIEAHDAMIIRRVVAIKGSDDKAVALRRLVGLGWSCWETYKGSHQWAELSSVTQVVCPLDVGNIAQKVYMLPPSGELSI